MTAFRRLAQGGRIDRAKPVTARFDGKPLMGFAGDTLASALLANDRIAHRPQLQVSPPARHSLGRHRGAERALHAGRGRAQRTQCRGHADRSGRWPRRTQPERLAVAGLRSHGGELGIWRRSSSLASTTRPSWARPRAPGCSTSPSSARRRDLDARPPCRIRTATTPAMASATCWSWGQAPPVLRQRSTAAPQRRPRRAGGAGPRTRRQPSRPRRMPSIRGLAAGLRGRTRSRLHEVAAADADHGAGPL